MSVRLGIILSSTVTNEQLDSIRDKYDWGLLSIDNKYVREQLTENESFFQVSRSDCDDLSGIGTYQLYNKNLTPLKNAISDPLVLDAVISEYEIRRKGYKLDVDKWVEIIKDLKSNYKINTVAIFWHVYSTFSDEEHIIFKKKERCKLVKLDYKCLMKLSQDVILYFD